jgi:hypothetical protein
MEKNRGETPTFLGMRWDRYRKLLAHRDILERRDIRAFRRIDHRGANNGNPNASGSVRLSGSHHVQWSKYDPNVGNYLTLDDPIFEDEQIKDGRCNFWDKWDPPF